ncbi:MAG: NHLP leader peptide family RiPP precursor [Synechocystis sp.]
MSNEKHFSQGFTPNLPLWSFQLQKDSKLALKTRKDLEIHLITRALKDESFRAELIANPKAIIEQEIGSKLPDELEITVLEETENTIYMVLPCNPYEGLSEEELKASLGMTYEDVAQWVLEQQRSTLLDEESSVKFMATSWRDEAFKRDLALNPNKFIERELGQKIQETIQFNVCTETVKRLFMVLPSISMEMIAEQLSIDEMINMPVIAGSGCPTSPPIPFTCGTGANSVGCFPPG